MRPNDRIDEEDLCIRCLTDHLRSLCNSNDIKFVPVDQKEQPPDYWITVQERTFAVEVTSITIETSVGYDAQCKHFEASVEAEAKRNGLLSGTYVLTVERYPSLPKRGSQQWTQWVNGAVIYMKTTRNSHQDNGIYLTDSSVGSIRVSKIGAQGDLVALVGPVSGLIARQGIVADMARLMQNAIVIKRKKLLKKDHDILKHCAGAVLLFYDAYGPTEASHALSGFNKCGFMLGFIPSLLCLQFGIN